MNKDFLLQILYEAFRNVTLDGGTSLKQAEIIDSYGEGVTKQEFDQLPRQEITADWQKIPFDELENHPYIAHFDPAGFRYYIPAFLKSVILYYDPGSMRVISTLSSLYPKKGEPSRMYHYSLLDEKHRTAIAAILLHLHEVVELTPEDRKITERAVRNYWYKFLPENTDIVQ